MRDVTNNNEYNFAGSVEVSSGYNYINPNNKNVKGGNEEPGELEFKAQYPQIKNINVTDSQKNIIIPTGDIYDIKNAGNYTITFNTEVNKNQVPIQKLVLRVIKVDDDKNFSSLSGSYLPANIDSLSHEDAPHNYSLQLSKGKYIVVIKVIDNWGFYRCGGINNIVSGNYDSCENFCLKLENNYSSYEGNGPKCLKGLN